MKLKVFLVFTWLLAISSVGADEPNGKNPKDDVAPPAESSATPDTDKPAPKPSTKLNSIDDELLRSLKDRVAPEQSEEPPLLRIGRKMRDVQGRLARIDVSEGTRSIQNQIVKDLDELIKQLKKGGKCPKCGSSNCNKHGQQTGRKTSGGKQQPQNQPSQAAKNSNPNQRTSPRTKEKPSDQHLQLVQLVRAVWGHLPEKLREKMQQDFKEVMLPGYEAMIEQYFRTIAEHGDESR